MPLRIKRLDPDSPAAVRIRALNEYVAARQAAEEAEAVRRKREAELMALLEEQEMKSTSGTIHGVKFTASVTSRTTTTFDEAGLKKALGARRYAKLTVPKLDKDKVMAAIDNGEVDAAVVAQHSTVTTGARSIRLTRKVDEGGEADPA